MISTNVSTESELLQELQAAGAAIRGRSIVCPFCDDKHPSAGIFQDNGHWRYKCHKCGLGGDVYDLQAKRTGEPLRNILSGNRTHQNGPQSTNARQDNQSHQKNRTPVTEPHRGPNKHRTYKSLDELKKSVERSAGGTIDAQYNYTDPDTRQVNLIVLRVKTETGKQFRQATPVDDGYVMKALVEPYPLYNRSRVHKADQVVICEGEKCVHSLQSVGITATTSPAGAKNADKADFSPLAGKTVIIWPDNDEPGHQYARDVMRLLSTLDPPAKVKLLDPNDLGLGEKQDAADFIDIIKPAFPEPADLKAHLENDILPLAKPQGISQSIIQEFEDIISGKLKAIRWPWATVHRLTMALTPGTVTLVCGSPGASKSFMLLQCLTQWHAEGVKVAAYMLEEDRKHHVKRAIAQKAAIPGLTNMDWIKEHPDKVRQAMEKHSDYADEIGRFIWECPIAMVTHDQLSAWAKQRAAAGCRVVAIDPITLAEPTREPWISDVHFMDCIKKIAVDFNISIVLVTHPTKENSGPALEQLAGSAIYGRACQAAIWLKYEDEPITSRVVTDCGTIDMQHNRTLHILKSRNGIGQGMRIAMDFSKDNLCLCEHGIIKK